MRQVAPNRTHVPSASVVLSPVSKDCISHALSTARGMPAMHTPRKRCATRCRCKASCRVRSPAMRMALGAQASISPMKKRLLNGSSMRATRPQSPASAGEPSQRMPMCTTASATYLVTRPSMIGVPSVSAGGRKSQRSARVSSASRPGRTAHQSKASMRADLSVPTSMTRKSPSRPAAASAKSSAAEAGTRAVLIQVSQCSRLRMRRSVTSSI